MIDGRNFFDQPVKNNLITYDNIQKIATSLGGDYTTGCLLDYNYFNNYYKMIAIDLSKQKALDANPKARNQINFRANLYRAGSTILNNFRFFTRNCESIVLLFCFNIMSI